MFWIILRQDLLLCFCNLSKVLANFLFFSILITTFFLLSQNEQFKASTAIWLALFSSLIFSSSEFLKKDFEDGNIEQMLIIFQNFEIFILAKMIVNWLIYCLPLAIITFTINPNFDFLILFLLATLVINFICCFCGSLSALGNSAPMISIIAMPLIIPILLIALGDFQTSLTLLAGLAIFFAAALSFATSKIIKIAEE